MWDEAKHPRDDIGRFAEVRAAVAGKLGWDAADWRMAAGLDAAGLKKVAATAGVSPADLKAAIAEHGAAPTVRLDDPAALTEAAHEAARSVPAWNGAAYDPASPTGHKVLIADLYDAMKEKIGGASLDDFKQALHAAMRSGRLSLGRNDMPQFARDQRQLSRSELAPGGGAQFHVVNVPANRPKAFFLSLPEFWGKLI